MYLIDHVVVSQQIISLIGFIFKQNIYIKTTFLKLKLGQV